MATFQDHCNNVISKVDLSKLNKIQQKYSKHDLKYLKYSFEVPYKMSWVINYLHLDTISKKDILDLGCGPGWFPFIATYFNHKVICTDVPNSISIDTVMFEEILHVLNLKKDFNFSILPQQKIPKEIGRFDIITALGMAFHHGWNLKDWYFFLDDIIDNHLKKDIECTIYFQVNRNQAWEILEQDSVYKTRNGIKKWEMFENHMLRILVNV